VELVSDSVPKPGPEEVRIRTVVSGISPGTERLIYKGTVSTDLPADANLPSLQDKTFDYPLSYGYACAGYIDGVGTDVTDEWLGERVFGFHPHASHFVSAPSSLIPIPEEVTFTEATLIPSVETAVNLVMDGRPVVGERVLVFGQGIIGLLTTSLLGRFPLDELCTVDPSHIRRELSTEMGATSVTEPAAAPPTVDPSYHNGSSSDGDAQSMDLTYELSGNPSALDDAIACTGFSGRIIIGSWYGTKSERLNLGTTFHRSRLRIRSSQVSTIDPQFQGRWTKDRRMKSVLSVIEESDFSKLVTHEYPIQDVSKAYRELVEAGEPTIQPVFRYP